MTTLRTILILLTICQAGFVIGVAGALAGIHRHSKRWKHVMLLAASYIILTLSVCQAMLQWETMSVGSIAFRSVGFLLGDIGLLVLLFVRNYPYVEK